MVSATYVCFLYFLSCIYRAGYALNENNQLKRDAKDVETSAHQGEDDVYYYNTKSSSYEKLNQNTLLSIEEGQLIL